MPSEAALDPLLDKLEAGNEVALPHLADALSRRQACPPPPPWPATTCCCPGTGPLFQMAHRETFVSHVYNIKNSLKFKLLAFWRKWTPFIDQKCTYEKVKKKFGQGAPPPSPPIGQNPKEEQLFFRETFP